MKKKIFFILFLLFLNSCNSEKNFEQENFNYRNIKLDSLIYQKIGKEIEKLNSLKDIKENNNSLKSNISKNIKQEKTGIKKEEIKEKIIIKKEIKKIVRLGDIYKFGPKSLHINSRGVDVRKVQMLLRDLGFYNRKITGFYDNYTLRAMKRALIVKCGWPKNNAGTFGKQPRYCILNLKIRKKEIITEEITKEEFERRQEEARKKLEEQKRLEKEKQRKLEEEKQRKLEEEKKFQDFLNAHTIKGATSIEQWKISLEKQKREKQEKLKIILKKREDEKLRLALAKKKAEEKRKKMLEEKAKAEEAKKRQEELIKRRKQQEARKKLEEQKAREEEQKRKLQEEELNRKKQENDNLSREERLKQKVEEYKKQKEKEAGIYNEIGGNSILEMKIKEERKIISELEERLEYHKKFLEEYEAELRKQQSNGDIFSLSPDEIKLIEEYRKANKKTSYSNQKKEVRYTKNVYIPTKGFYEKKNGIITCSGNKKLTGVSYSTFKELGDNYARDIAKIYYGCDVIKSGDVNDFRLIKYGFAKDNDNVYYRGKKMDLVENPQTFWVDSKGNFKIAYDENNVYLFDAFGIRRILKNTSFEDVEYLSKTYFKGKNNIIIIYCDTEKCHFDNLKGVDYYSFEALGFGFAKDKNGVYYKGRKIPNIDIYTVEALSHTKIKDKNGIYKLYNGRFIKIK